MSTNNNHKYIVWGIRIFVAALFVLSAVAKLWPSPTLGIGTFEAKYLGGMGIEGTFAKVLSRLLIGLEFTLAVLLLLPFYLKKVVIPATIGLLGVFSIHLLIQVASGESGNCGCFGELIPMSPLQSVIKNIIAIGLLILPLTKFKDGLEDKKNLNPILLIGLSVALLMFVLIPQGGNSTETETVEIEKGGESEFEVYFEDIAQGNKLLCFFSPTCEHCMATGKALTELKKKYPGLIPEIRILFMDEVGNGSEEEVAKFFEFIGAEYTYKVLSVEEFIPIFFAEYNFPGVKYLYNGEERIFFEGIEDNEFDADKLLEEIKREY
ncbi:MauE/DoxX family redox-associated membrane protein [Parvicella tangerina]|uniref:Methylamine utilisation protein MauE domain-containing protein n=1 Tax=Parvicella tangerina TaxID=2829795 RepID=A0A916JNT3_9FLAO|nr:MauE/DoxX family redox-associated membrane protein [Parvicella tangerina]CAG5084467.1 hypothetical protein CRYO30217_02472 [Parvicella tangerina]